ncbi:MULTISPECIES: hypothetical protein [Paenibacillus]|uniref:Fur-regulated basic protein FbpA n=1 Tax=Paenibacillus glycanilyticus TaxID=126569 RepID=A0ABQ6NLW0_9BACL|nr:MULTISPECIES: hypothetical protein [Paenibacillus]NIK70884.1 hypothetical protein [Paenibacillus sp. BK720]GMK45217.1 hypothetical protein PghCCS26_23450 [Paenibacillus glycanilyticus]
MSKSVKQTTYSKAQILKASCFTPLQRDFLKALLEEGKFYTVDDAAKQIEQYLKQEAK